ncbi:MAG: helix-turn-helix domain-containing protein [Bauldia sp.]|nr:helix-turn-helix domain-containing protein [Bauldia sp.]
MDNIRSLCLFRDVAEQNFADLVRYAAKKRIAAHTHLVSEGEHCAFLYLVLEGTVELYSRRGRREASIGMVRGTHAFFLGAAIWGLPSQASARTIEPSLIFRVPAEDARSVYERDGGFARGVFAEVTRTLRRMTMELKAQRLSTSIERLANWILVQEERRGGRGGFRLPYDKRTLAAHLGMTPENLSRNFAALSEHGVAVQGREVVVSDLEKLAAFAEPARELGDWDY